MLPARHKRCDATSAVDRRHPEMSGGPIICRVARVGVTVRADLGRPWLIPTD